MLTTKKRKSTRQRKPLNKKRVRPWEDDPEEEIPHDDSIITIADLCKDLKRGRKSNTFKELELAKYKKNQLKRTKRAKKNHSVCSKSIEDEVEEENEDNAGGAIELDDFQQEIYDYEQDNNYAGDENFDEGYNGEKYYEEDGNYNNEGYHENGDYYDQEIILDDLANDNENFDESYNRDIYYEDGNYDNEGDRENRDDYNFVDENINQVENETESNHDDESTRPIIMKRRILKNRGSRFINDDGQYTMREEPKERREGINGDDMEVIEEDKFSHMVNSGSYAKKPRRNERWTTEETELFYKSLSQWGTDFEIIAAKSFLNTKTRDQIKNKYKKERKHNSERVNNALDTRIPVAIEELNLRVIEEIEESADNVVVDEESADNLIDEEPADNVVVDEESADNVVVDEEPADNVVVDEEPADNVVIDEEFPEDSFSMIEDF